MARHQYCLKWNNHKNNISGVFDRLRNDERFVDVTLASSDQKSIKCHRILLSAGSGYLESILDQNPSDHPTIILSQIQHNELKHLVEFMYSGEVAVEQESLPKLLEAANILQIKGLYEAPNVTKDIDDKEETLEENQDAKKTDLKVPEPEKLNIANVLGSQKRKKRKSTCTEDQKVENKVSSNKKVKSEENDSQMDNSKLYSPLFGISNAYFLSNQQKSTTSNVDVPNVKLPKDVPNLLTQHPLSPNSILPNFAAFMSNATSPNKSEIEKSDATPFLSNAPVRRYKQYTEDTLQQALKEIMNGQSINRSSMKYNIPARTLRDWMKRLNIKSVFTHHSQKEGRSLSADSASDYSNAEMNTNANETNSDGETSVSPKPELEASAEDTSKMNGSVFPGMKYPSRNGSIEDQNSTTEEDEEEIDDDEEGTLEIKEEKV